VLYIAVGTGIRGLTRGLITPNIVPRAGCGVVRIDPLCFLAGGHTRRLN